MKKLIGIILAVCMLGTLASAATVTTSDVTAPLDTMTVTFKYAGLDAAAQATMLAYDVTDVEGATAETAYVNEETTPIVGIDQEAADGEFSFKVATDFRGSIVVKVGGTDVAAPTSFLVTFADPVDPKPDEPTYTTVTVVCGDVTGDNIADGTDASLILASTLGGSKVTSGAYNIGALITTIGGVNVVCGDVTGDGIADGTDASLILASTLGGSKVTSGAYNIGAEITFQVEVTPEG